MRIRHKTFLQALRGNEWGCLSTSSSSTSQPVTTVSGSGQSASGSRSQNVGSGSIGVSGDRARYLEQGAIDLSESKGSGVGGQVGTISTGQGATVNIGDPGALDKLKALSDEFANTVESIAANNTSGMAAVAAGQPVTENEPLSYKTIGLIIAGITAVLGALYFIFGRKNA